MSGHPQYSDSPFLAMMETTIEEWRDGHSRVGLVLKPFHLNRSGVVHGGVLATLLDHACAISGLYCTVPGNRRYGMTLSLTTNYLAQSRAGKVFAIGERTTGGKTVFFASGRVETDTGLVLATGSGVFRYRGGSESPEGVSPRTADLS